MADTVTVSKLFDGIRVCEFEFTNISDGTGEAAVTKIDLSTLVGRDGTTSGTSPISLAFENGDWEVNGFNYVNVLWDRTAADETIQVMVDSGGVDLGYANVKVETDKVAAGTGDILLTTNGGAAGSGYRIRLRFRKKYA
jgi:hypothetical protein